MYYHKYQYNTHYFKNIDTEDKAYWAGFIAADGNVRKDYLKMRLELNIKDLGHLEKFKKAFKEICLLLKKKDLKIIILVVQT